MADMHTPLLIAINEEGDERATMRLDDCPSIEDVIETLTEWMWTDPMRRLTIRAPSQGAETIKALRDALGPLAGLPLGAEIENELDVVIYKNAGRSITVGDVLTARAVLAGSAS